VSLHTGLRWSEQLALEWKDADFLTGILSVTRSKNGHSRQVPMNSLVRSTLMDVAAQRGRADRFFPPAVQQAGEALRKAGRDASRLSGYTWHSNRHTFASRLVMAGVNLRAVQELGGWRTFSMVGRYSHLAPEFLREAVERLVWTGSGAVELSRN
jgi:site-specific recombinase XerD